MSKIFSRSFERFVGFALCLAFAACATAPQAPFPPNAPPPSSPPPAVQKRDQPLPHRDESPRAVASLHLTEQARALLENGKVDDAITALERAMNLNPSNGQNYYYLAEAWLKKGKPSQAREFNRLAAMYLKDDPNWMNRVKDQQERMKPR